MSSWGIAALVDEPGGLVAAFAAHHLELGAEQVHIMLDRPNEEARDLLSGNKQVTLTQAGDDDWGYFGPRPPPPRHLGRQKYHASRVLASTPLDWILHCDADEFLMPVAVAGLVATPVSLVLSLQEEATDWVRVNVAERVWVQGVAAEMLDGPFRLPWQSFETQGSEVYSDGAMLQLKCGLAGHNMGKAIARSGRGYFMGIHHAQRDYQGTNRDLQKAETRRLRILHFDGLTLLHYALKMMRRALADRTKNPPPHGVHRRLQFNALAGAQGDVGLIREQWSAAKLITQQQADQLRQRKLLWDINPKILERGQTLVPALGGLTAASFDAALVAREADLIAHAHDVFGFDPAPLMAG